MTPTDILAAARLSPLSPVVAAREEWIKGWRGPVLLAGQRATVFWTSSDGRRVGVITDELREEGTYMVGLLSLDLRRPEVRDRLIRCGAPEWCMESVAGMLGWVLGGRPDDDFFRPLTDDEKVSAVADARCVLEEADGWYIPLPGGAVGWLPKESA